MLFDKFIELYRDKPCIWDAKLGTQCMALSHFYIYICLDIYDKSVLSANVAKNVWYKWQPAWDKYFKRVENGPTNFPSKGDIVIWKGTYGHIAICTEANSMTFYSFDANYPVGSYPHIQFHDYTNVVGWLRPV
jgi:hypothetical protein